MSWNIPKMPILKSFELCPTGGAFPCFTASYVGEYASLRKIFKRSSIRRSIVSNNVINAGFVAAYSVNDKPCHRLIYDLWRPNCMRRQKLY